MDNSMITTAFELPGYRITKNLGVVRGITVRSRSIIGNFLGGIQSLFGGNITIYTALCGTCSLGDISTHAAAWPIAQSQCDYRNALRRNRAHGGSDRSACYGTAVIVDPH
nr:heavy metal-binding domain-containing protein [Propionivibrio sp.]